MKYFLILFSFVAAAETYRIAGDLVKFKTYQDVRYYCPTKYCTALKILKKGDKIDPTLFPREQFSNPLGAQACRHYYKGKTLLGRNEKLDGRSFCLFKDESLLEISSLTKFVEKRVVNKKGARATSIARAP